MSAEKIETPPPANTPPSPPPASNDGSGDKTLTIQADWPADWREKSAGEDKDFIKQLSRFSTPADLAKSYSELQKKVSSGEYKKNIPFPKDGTPEQQNEWRKEVGIPESPDKYDLKFDNGLVIGEDAKPIVDKWLAKAHQLNMPPEYVKGGIASYMEIEQEIAAQAVKQERDFTVKTEESLRQKWGPEYLPNKNLAENFAVNTFGPDIGKAIMQAGPEAVEALVRLSRDLNPAMTVVPNSSDPSASIADEIKQLEGQMGTMEWKSDKSKQQRYLDLIEARGRMKK